MEEASKGMAKFFYEQCAGSTCGHMAHIPNNPVLYSLLMAHSDTAGEITPADFATFLRRVANQLDPQ